MFAPFFEEIGLTQECLWEQDNKTVVRCCKPKIQKPELVETQKTTLDEYTDTTYQPSLSVPQLGP